MRTLVTILYWMLSVVVAALVVSSAGYTFQESILMGTMFLPGALAAKYFFPKVSFKKRSEGVLNVIYIVRRKLRCVEYESFRETYRRIAVVVIVT